jgi:hypothetical protein
MVGELGEWLTKNLIKLGMDGGYVKMEALRKRVREIE